MRERVARCVAIKVEVVVGDEREEAGPTSTRGRAILNYGHTLAHALEASGEHDLRHGEAVAIGLVYAAELAAELGRIDRARVDEHRRVVVEYGLDPSLPAWADPPALTVLMGRDKKALDGLTFVLDGPTGVEVVADVPVTAVQAAFVRMKGSRS
jgi:5-deoxy-5-amino-3-dehydroquinate synthase